MHWPHKRVKVMLRSSIWPDVRPGNPLFTAIKHVNGVPPCGGALNLLGEDPADEARANALGLFAHVDWLVQQLRNHQSDQRATSWTSEATSIVAVNGLPRKKVSLLPVEAILFSRRKPMRQSTAAWLQSCSVLRIRCLRTGRVAALNFDVPDMSTPYTRLNGGLTAISPIRQASNLSMAIATTSIRNEFLTTSSISAATDWTLSFPTRRYNLALDYAAVGEKRIGTDFTSAQNQGGDDDGTGVRRVNYFTLANTSVETSARTNSYPQICVGAGSVTNAGATVDAAVLSFYDTSERANVASTDFVISPGAGPRALSFCGEVTVLTFDQDATQPSRVLNAFITRNDITVPAFPGTSVKDSGWLSIATGGLGGGLPLLGSYFLKATNPANVGFSTNYGGNWEHRYQRPTPATR